jgi:hypothetical protein
VLFIRLPDTNAARGPAQLSRHQRFAAFAAFEYKNDYGHAYWGTPLVPN